MATTLQKRYSAAQSACMLATLDWVGAPMSVIMEELVKNDGDPYTASTICEMRKSDVYREMVGALKSAWEHELAKKSSSFEMRNSASSILRSSLKRMMEIVARPKTQARDIIAIARLTAQMTGNIIVETADAEGHTSEKQESIASELITALGRMKGEGTVQ